MRQKSGPVKKPATQVLVTRLGVAAGIMFLLHPQCCGMPATISWPMKVSIPVPSSTTSGTGILLIRCATPSCHPIGSRASGGTERGREHDHPGRHGVIRYDGRLREQVQKGSRLWARRSISASGKVDSGARHGYVIQVQWY